MALTATSPTAELRVEPLTNAIGAVIEGIDLAEPLVHGGIDALRAAVHRHGVVFLRGQHLSVEELGRFSEQLAPSPCRRCTASSAAVAPCRPSWTTPTGPPPGSPGTPT